MNFDLLNLEDEYASLLQVALNYADPAEWCQMFNSWQLMTLREDLQFGPDFRLITLSNWTKLKMAFGGGPEIPFFQYQAEV
mmetsp:Transcript_43588/g.57741  ORF Transcript_43588/g.57741 Transcript_43588/m.57741 type:complete len:81 (-) Transcript_43588:1510-1752(-)